MGDGFRQRSHREGWEMTRQRSHREGWEMRPDKGAIERDGRWVQTKEP